MTDAGALHEDTFSGQHSRGTGLRLPFAAGPVHFVGIGGAGMCGIAEVMHNLGYTVSGSDIACGPDIDRLRALGISVATGHDPENVAHADAVVISTAIRPDNPEVSAARAGHIPVVRRADMLAELMRLKWTVSVAGTHGKTTTTSMIAALLDEAGLDPTVINGGIINAYGANARLGAGDWMVVEADESDGTFIRLPTTMAVVTNMDREHLDYWGGFEKLRHAFDTFVENIPFYGYGIVCLDHPEVQALVGRVTDRRLITYGVNLQADVRAENIRFDRTASYFDIVFRERGQEAGRLDGIRLPMPGTHNVLNALPAAIVAGRLGIPHSRIRAGLSGFAGVSRRFTIAGEWKGVVIVDDYGHHPAEIAAVLCTARRIAAGRVIAVVQPHRFTRIRDLFDEFCACLNEADVAVITDVYAAGEAPLPEADRDALVSGLENHGHGDVRALGRLDDLPDMIMQITRPGDYVICFGAGDITRYARALPAALSRREEA